MIHILVHDKKDTVGVAVIEVSTGGGGNRVIVLVRSVPRIMGR